MTQQNIKIRLANVSDAKTRIYEIITERHKAEIKKRGDVTAIEEALKAMAELDGDTVEARILGYHSKEPEAWLFRDENTMRALRAGLKALQRMETLLQEELTKCKTGS